VPPPPPPPPSPALTLAVPLALSELLPVLEALAPSVREGVGEADRVELALAVEEGVCPDVPVPDAVAVPVPVPVGVALGVGLGLNELLPVTLGEAPPAVLRAVPGVPGARHEAFADASHGLPIQHPDRVNTLLAEHFDKIPGVVPNEIRLRAIRLPMTAMVDREDRPSWI
jgi:pimeloyl-ACP methyl ester carboxylesterase